MNKFLYFTAVSEKHWYLSFLFKGDNQDANVTWTLNGVFDSMIVPANSDTPKEFDVSGSTKPANITLMVYKANGGGQQFFNKGSERNFAFTFEFVEVKPTTPVILVIGDGGELNCLLLRSYKLIFAGGK